ncbi:HTH-type transcriptional repressor KstR2 [Oxobacter pfennigii]|uniref:HTH-type transcriptional repressor KstR2 n=1 Tax=Oxobacter pfennigii TaxID=36849 RepID=A0A0P9ADH8_9CLOT|nr:TetR/AcrR family transcriptional regulator [Oxobacter pfennigii]KPU43178.1 HTH-type transcriptional repressor KstR2 [Oxobacter pfennigii]
MPKKTFFNLPPEKKQRIIEATYDMFIDEKYENVNIREIASRSGISIGSFYQYFNDKDDLYLYFFNDIEKKYRARQKEIMDSILLGMETVPIEEVCTEKEIAFNRTWYKVPMEVMQKFYFGEYSKELNASLMDELIEFKKAGKLKDSVDIEFIFHFYATSMFNILTYFREHNITDENEKLELKRKYYKDIFLNGILKSE